eukprot:2438138-Pyramimonas_sp.AAC.1
MGDAHFIDGGGQHHSLTTRELFTVWGIAPTSLEPCVRRLKWWQNISREVEHHEPFLSGFFGRCHIEDRCASQGLPTSANTLTESGALNTDPKVHPWARQLREDLLSALAAP